MDMPNARMRDAFDNFQEAVTLIVCRTVVDDNALPIKVRLVQNGKALMLIVPDSDALGVDVLIHCSVDDHHFFCEQLPEKPQIVARPSMDDVFVGAVAAAQKIAPIDILLVGTDHHANAEAVEWFPNWRR